MSMLAVFYLIKSVQECIQSADENRAPPYELVVCDLPLGRDTHIFVLNAITSAAMLTYKVVAAVCFFAPPRQ
jgi:hypothetical protein